MISDSCHCLNVTTLKHKYALYTVFVINWKAVKRAACYFYPFNMLPWFKAKNHASSIHPQNFIKSRKHSFYGNLILIYTRVFIIWFLLSLLSLLLYSKCCDHSFLFGFSCLLETMWVIFDRNYWKSIDLSPLFRSIKTVQYSLFFEDYWVSLCTMFCLTATEGTRKRVAWN